MAQSLHFQRNVSPSTVSSSKSEQLANSEKEIFVLNNIGPLDMLALNALILALSLTPVTTDKLFK